MEAFLPTGKPILGICRDCQFLNIYLGATLHQHMEGHADFNPRAEDGTVEAIELTDRPFCVAVQWHPDHLSNTRSDQQKLFDHFASLCK